MQTLITPTVVVARAFADGEYVAPETVSEAAIVAAQETYLRPVTGDALFERLLAGDHADFADEYLAAPLALYVRYLIAPQLDLRHGQGGTVQPRSDGFAAASDATLRRSRRALLKTARRAAAARLRLPRIPRRAVPALRPAGQRPQPLFDRWKTCTDPLAAQRPHWPAGSPPSCRW